MQLQTFQAVDEFYERTVDFLAAAEAENNLILGICSSLMRTPAYSREPPYLATVEADGQVVAAAVRTPPHNLVLSTTDSPEAVDLIAREVAEVYPSLPGALGPGPVSARFVTAWRELTGQEARLDKAERIYRLRSANMPEGVPGELRRATRDDYDVLLEWLLAFYAEAVGPVEREQAEWTLDFRLESPTSGFYIWVDGGPVSLTGYGGPTPHGIRIGPVYTPPELRGHGYASACVAQVSQLLLDGGYEYCCLYTDLSNPTSNHIYQVIGYEPVIDVDQYELMEAGGL